jgi:hypothetical protein
MPLTLEEETQRRRLEEALSHLDTGAVPLDTAPAEDSTLAPESAAADGSDYPAAESGPKIKVPKQVKGEYGDWNQWQTLDQPPVGHIDLAPPGPTPTPESSFGPDLQTDPETGQRYVVDPTVSAGMVPFAELATEADKEKLKPTDVTLPKRTVEAQPVTYPTIAEDQPLSLPPDPQSIWQQYRDGKISRDEAIAQAAQLQEQVKRATLVKLPGEQPATMPWHPAGEKPVPGFVEGSQNAILNPAAAITPVRRAELIDPDPDAQYLDPEVRRAALAGTTPKATPAVLPTGPKAPGTHTELAPPGQMDLREDTDVVPQPATATTTQPEAKTTPAKSAVAPVSGDWRTWTTTDGTPAEPAVSVPASTVAPMNAPNGKAPVALIIHHTSGRNGPASVVEDWRTNRPGVGAQMIVDRDGSLHYTQKEFGYGGTGNFLHSVIPGVSNQTAVGVEVVAKDDADMTPAEIETLKRLASGNGPYSNIPVYGHSQVSPGDRDNEGVRGVAAINEARKAGGAETDSTQVIQQLNASGLKTTHYGYDGDPNLDADSAAGHGKYVQQMISGYDVALNDAAAKLVGNPKPGEEFQYAGRTWRYADKVPEKYSDARFDIFDSNNTALSGGPLGGTRQVAEAPKKQDWESWATLSPAEQTAATAQGVQKSQDILNTLHSKSTNMPDWFHTLEQPIPGVSDEVRTAVRDEYKKQITAYAQDYYQEQDPNKAFARIMSAPNLLTSAGEIWTKAGANFQHMWLSLAQQADSPTQTKLIEFINAVHPEATPEARTALINQVMARTGKDRVDFVNHLYNDAQAHNPDSVKNVNMFSLLDAIDVSAQPGMQAKEQENHAKVVAAVEQNRKNLREDPTMEGTYGGMISNAIAQMPKNVLEAIVPVLGQSAMFSEIYTDTLAGLRKDHPDWTEDQLKAKAAAASLPQDVLQELVNAATLGMGSGVTKGIANPIARIATNAIMHGTIAGGAGATQQALANVATGRPQGEGVAQAGIAGGIQGLIGGALTGRHPAEALESPVPHPFAEEKGSPLPPTQPVTREGVLEPNAPAPRPGPGEHWYEPPPIVTRGTERTTFTPSELVEQASTITGRTPEELMTAAEKLQPPMDFIQRSVFLNSDTAQQAEILKARAAQQPAPEPEAVRMQPGESPPQAGPAPQAQTTGQFVPSSQWQEVPEHLAVPPGGEYKVNMATGKTEARWTGKVPGPEKVIDKRTGKPQGEGPTQPRASTTGAATQAQAGKAEPWMSKIANRFMAERIAKGDIGPVEPGHGETTEALVARGSKMGPETVAQHVSNLMHDVGGNPVDQAAAVRFEEARLSQRSHELSRIADENPGNQQARIDAEDALKYVTDWHKNVVAKLKNNWHKMGMTLQGDVPVEFHNYNGLREEFFKNTGKMPPSQTEPVLRKAARRVLDASTAEAAAMKKLGAEIDKEAARRPMPNHEQVREAIAKRMRGEFPCPT